MQHHTVEQLADVVPMEQILDIPVPQMGDQLVASLKHLDTPIPEQVTAVPKISLSSRRSRTVLREPQTAEQLVEVPAVVSFSSLQQTAEQIIDIPVPRTRGRGDRRGLHCFPQDKFRRSVLCSRSSTFLLVVVFKIFSLILGCQPHPQSRVMRRFNGFFRTQKKNAQSAGRSSARGARALELMDASGEKSSPRRRTPTAGSMSTAACGRGRFYFFGGGSCWAPAWPRQFTGTSLVRVRWVPGEQRGVRLLLPGFLRWAWCWREYLSGLPSYSEAFEAAACGG